MKRQLRQEVGFRCPVRDCGNPYLTWHHFDPPWRVEQHHRPEGMIALCAEHAAKADHGAFTDDQLRELKRIGRDRSAEVRARFDWMRQKMLGIVGGNFYYESPIVLTVGPVRCIWWSRDEDGNLLFNLRIPGFSHSRRPRIDENWWSVLPDEIAELEAPPNGRKIKVAYPNGDVFSVEFSSAGSVEELTAQWPEFQAEWAAGFEFPVTTMEVSEKTAGAEIELSPSGVRIGGNVQWVAQWGMYRRVSVAGIGIGDSNAALGVPVDTATFRRLLASLDISLDEHEEASVPRTVHHGESIRLLDLLEVDQYGISWIRGHDFVECELVGPAVLMFPGRVELVENGFDRDQLWEIDPDRGYLGAIGLDQCLIQRCTFRNIGIAGPAEWLANISGR